MKLHPLILLLLLAGCGAPSRAIDEPTAVETVLIAGGTFVMGDVFEGTDPDATPAHPQEVSDFLITPKEITIGLYRSLALQQGLIVPKQPGPAHDDQAVVNVTWYEASAFCRSHGLRLPTEVEWEYAARDGGLNMPYPGFANADSANAYMRHADNSVSHPFLAGMKKPNKLGLYDMGGNVYEWIGAFYLTYPESGELPEWVDLEDREIRVIRGGSFRSNVSHSRTFRRAGTLTDLRSDHIGFRCAGNPQNK